jgi:hypothetical protein
LSASSPAAATGGNGARSLARSRTRRDDDGDNRQAIRDFCFLPSTSNTHTSKQANEAPSPASNLPCSSCNKRKKKGRNKERQGGRQQKTDKKQRNAKQPPKARQDGPVQGGYRHIQQMRHDLIVWCRARSRERERGPRALWRRERLPERKGAERRRVSSLSLSLVRGRLPFSPERERTWVSIPGAPRHWAGGFPASLRARERGRERARDSLFGHSFFARAAAIGRDCSSLSLSLRADVWTHAQAQSAQAQSTSLSLSDKRAGFRKRESRRRRRRRRRRPMLLSLVRAAAAVARRALSLSRRQPSSPSLSRVLPPQWTRATRRHGTSQHTHAHA